MATSSSVQPSVHQLYRRLETIGKGAYGSVHKGEHIPSGNVVALKIINLDDKSGSDDVGDIQREVALLTQLRDAPNITRYYGCYMDGPRVWIVMEFAQGGSVLSLMKASRNGCLEEKYVSVIVREVLVGLNYLHKVPVIHRDIKAANILVTATGKVVICDFGVSAVLATSSSKRNTLTGTPHWMAPELLANLPVYDTKADIWSLGIVVYEMIKGTPPHHTLENIKVMDLIPKTQPPRLGDHEASKDLREFMTMCLRESPAERLPADELSKSKWIKSVAKVSVSVLKDLVTRFEQAAKRASLAEPLDWEEEEERDLMGMDQQDNEKLWEFETVRGRSFLSQPFDEDPVPYEAKSEEQSMQTIRSPPHSSTLPSSLRSLFEDESEPSQPILRPPVFQLPSHPGTPSPPSSVPPPISSSPGRERLGIKRPPALDTLKDEPTVKQKTFVYPPRGMARSRSKLSSSVPGSDDEAVSHTHIHLESKLTPSPRTMPSHSLDSPGEPSKKSTLRDPRTLRSKQLPSAIDTVPLPSEDEIDETSPSTTVTPGPPSSVMPSLPSGRPVMGRRRSQSTGEALGPRRNGRADLDLASPSAFQFPPSAHHPPSSDQTTSTSQSRSPPNHFISGTPGGSHSTHQVTYSLDTSASTWQKSAPSPLPLSIARTRSATTFPESTDIPPLRKAPVNGAPLLPPLKPFALPDRNRGGSDVGSNMSSGTPGLKDVLKIPFLTSEHHLGMSDLLPPSPSASAYTARSFFASPSSLSSSVTNNPEYSRQHSAFREAAEATSSFSLGLQPPPILRRTATEPSFLPVSTPSNRGNLHSRNISLNNGPTSIPHHGPPIRPLDYNRLITADDTYSELARTIDDLTQWLTVVEVGLSGMLEKIHTDTIEEEQEVTSDLEDEQVTPGHSRRSRKATIRADV
ncbi:hypothetical protein H0H87_007622 [Tephrocybe sp. NHM501043]|nr:hypothetical protein H0H87_007622 [Tephrocybe sp. NHM501043]